MLDAEQMMVVAKTLEEVAIPGNCVCPKPTARSFSVRLRIDHALEEHTRAVRGVALALVLRLLDREAGVEVDAASVASVAPALQELYGGKELHRECAGIRTSLSAARMGYERHSSAVQGCIAATRRERT